MVLKPLVQRPPTKDGTIRAVSIGEDVLDRRRPDRDGDLRPWADRLHRWTIGLVEALEPHRWKLTFETREDDDHCEMVVHLDAGDRSLSGHGRSRRNPIDPSVPQIGEELAAARALHDLANHLTEDAWAMIESHPKQT